ncbi:hypothetical protein Vretimale_3740, partial [Volvox reticuliferus]
QFYNYITSHDLRFSFSLTFVKEPFCRMAHTAAGRQVHAASHAHPIITASLYHSSVAFRTTRRRAGLSPRPNNANSGLFAACTRAQLSDDFQGIEPDVMAEPMAVAPRPLESLDDMAAFVERTRQEEENIRRRREEVELQLLRMRQQEAVRRQQAIKLRLASERANAAVLREQGGTAILESVPASAPPPGFDLPVTGAVPAEAAMSAATSAATSAVAVAQGGAPPSASNSALVVIPKKKVVLKKSKRMTAVAAAAGLHRVVTPPPQGTGAARLASNSVTAGGSDASLALAGATIGGSGSVGKALLSREELIEKRKDVSAASPAGCESGDEDCGFDQVIVPKPIFIISDCTGESAARTVRAALNQFEMRCRTQAPAQIMIYRFVESVDKMMGIIHEAAKEDALVVYTLVDPKAVKVVQTACKLQNVRYVDLWTALLDTMEVHLNAVRSGVPASLTETRKPTASLTDEYFRMIEAVEYTRKMDDGAHPQEWVNADLVILGVSRCGKTPLSIYLGQRGYKVANLPLIPGCPVPRELNEIDQTRIVGLIIDPNVLATIRRNRVNIMGVSRAQAIDYAEVKKINAELDWARKLYNAHPDWPVIDVTLRGIEETAARILKMLNDRRGDASPKWVEAYHAKQHAMAMMQRPAAAEESPYNIPEMIYGAHESTFLMQGLY